MAPKASGSPTKGASASKQLKTSKLSSAPPRATIGRYTRDWQISTEYKPQRKISDDELNAAKKMFFALDVDSSGSIDADELGVMLRSLGQNPSEAELKALIDSVDDGDKDGKIQLREFLTLYTTGLDSKNRGSQDDVDDVFRSIIESTDGDSNGAPSERRQAVTKDALVNMLRDGYGIDMDASLVDEVLSIPPGKASNEIQREDMGNFLAAEPGVEPAA